MKSEQPAAGKDWRSNKLWSDARNLSVNEIESLEVQLREDQSIIAVRLQLASYYSEYEKNKLKHKDAEQKLFEHILWLIEHRVQLDFHLQHRIAAIGTVFRPKAFGRLRQAWLEEISQAPLDGNILGTAAAFIAWNDIETASGLFERAHSAQPEAGWLGLFVIFCHGELELSPAMYKDKIREQIIDCGIRSLQSEQDTARFLTCECVSDAALSLGRFEIVRWCAEILRDWNSTTCEQMANAYIGLVALREGNRNLAVQMLKVERGYEPQPIVFRLAGELFDLGERESIIRLIDNLKGKLRASLRAQWLAQIARDEAPDFDDYCC